MSIKNEESPVYGPIKSTSRSTPVEYLDGFLIKAMSVIDQDTIIDNALNILKSRMERSYDKFISSPQETKQFLILKLAPLEHEVFAVIFLDNQHRIIEYKEMFRGTIDSATVPPREVLKEALKQNAKSVIFAHNHPSGVPEPSNADDRITSRLREVLGMVDISVLDHIIVGGTDTVSYAERGLL